MTEQQLMEALEFMLGIPRYKLVKYRLTLKP